MYLLQCIVNVKLNQSRKAYSECKMAAIEMFYPLDLLMLSEKCPEKGEKRQTMMSISENFKDVQGPQEALEKLSPHSR
ncbi:unnamed protein product [Gadus morhua 'NCC']|jgi:hypothetical protein